MPTGATTGLDLYGNNVSQAGGVTTITPPATANINNAADNKGNAVATVNPSGNDGGNGLSPTSPIDVLKERLKASGMNAGQFVQNPDALKGLSYTSEQAYNLLNPTPTNTLTSDAATGEIYKNNEYLTTAQKNNEAAKGLLQQQKESLVQQEKAQEEAINRTFDKRQRQLETQQGEESATNKAIQFRLGRSATDYGASAVQKLNVKHNDQLDELAGQRATLIGQAQAALSEGNYKIANALIQEDKDLADKQYKIQQDQKAEKAQLLDTQLKEQQLSKGNREESEAVAKSIVPNLFQDFESNPDMDYTDTIRQYAEQTGVDPLILSSAFNTYRDEKRKDEALSAKTNLDYIKSLSETTGEPITTNLPGVGEVTIKPKGDYSIIQQKGGSLVVFDKNTGKVSRAVVSASDLNPENINNLITEISKPVVKLGADGKPIGSVGTFDDFMKGLQEKAGLSFGPDLKAKAKEQYDALVAQNQTPVAEKDISKYSFEVQQVIKGLMDTTDVLNGGTAGERAKFRQELKVAENEGLLQKQLSPEQKDFISSLNEKVSKNPTYTKTTSMRNYADNVAASLSLGTGVGDIAAINQFQKVIDEGAVTRDQDVQLIQGSQSLVNTLKTKMKKLEKGEQLSPELRQQMRKAVESLYEAQIKAIEKDPYFKSKFTEVKSRGIDPGETILGELGGFSAE